jgi:alanine racemase
MEPLIEARERGEQNDQNAHSAEIRKCLSGLTPALQVFAKRTQITECVGEGAGYGMRKSKTPYLATYRLGYADGFFRTVPLGEGNLCMDAFVGENRGEWLPVLTDAKAYAKQAGTICYEVLCKLSLRSHRIYV